MTVICRVCHRALRSLISRMEGVGPVCRRRVRDMISTYVSAVREGRDISQIMGFDISAESMTDRELRTIMEENARTQYLQRMRQFNSLRRNRNQQEQPVVFQPFVMQEMVGRYRNGTMIGSEQIDIRFLNENGTAMVTSANGHIYNTTSNACTCADFVFRRRGTGEPCRHMMAVRQAMTRAVSERRVNEWIPLPPEQIPATDDVALQQQITQAEQSNQTQEQENVRVRENPSTSAIEQAPAVNMAFLRNCNWQNEEARCEALNMYTDLYGHEEQTDYVNDDSAFNALINRNKRNFFQAEYKMSDVFGGIRNTFGVELEMYFDHEDEYRQCLKDLYDAGITVSRDRQNYSTMASGNLWVPKWDRSIQGNYTFELTSSVLNDNPDSWSAISKASEICKNNNAKVNNSTGTHMHIGAQVFGNDQLAVQHLTQIVTNYEGVLFRMAGSNYDHYEDTKRGTPVRKSHYIETIGDAQQIQREFDRIQSRNDLDDNQKYLRTLQAVQNGTRYRFVSFQNIITGRIPTIEFRQPNGTLNAQQIQDIAVINQAIVMAAATIKNPSKRQKYLAKMNETANHFRYIEKNKHRFANQAEMKKAEELAFRKFLNLIPQFAHDSAVLLWISGKSRWT